MSLSVMLDLETLDVKPTATILTLGMVKFDPYSLEEPADPYYVRFNIDEQSNLGRTTDEGTLSWWAKQSAEAQAEAFSDDDRVGLEEITAQINKYIVGVDKIFANGTTFDITILENLYRMLGKPIPWQYYQIRDARTIYDLGDDSTKKNNASAHNALADSYMQAQSVQQIYKNLGVIKKA